MERLEGGLDKATALLESFIEDERVSARDGLSLNSTLNPPSLPGSALLHQQSLHLLHQQSLHLTVLCCSPAAPHRAGQHCNFCIGKKKRKESSKEKSDFCTE